METEIHVARGLLADVTASAAGLQSAVESTSSKIANMTTLSGVTNSVLRWGWLTLLLFIIYQFNPRYAGCAAAGLATLLLLWASGTTSPFARIPSDAVLIHYASGYQVPLLPALKIMALSLVLTIAGLVYYLSAGLQESYHRTLSVASLLPFKQRLENSDCHL